MGASTVPASSRRLPVHHAFVYTGEGVILQLGGQGQMGGVVLGGDDETGGVPVDAVDDAGPLFTVDAAQTVAAVPQQGVDQRAVRVAGGGVDHQCPPAC